MPVDADDTTQDAVLGGRLVLRQPRRGHRVGHDAILLAAATAAHGGERAVDLGAGVGAAGLALARRVAGVSVTLVEIDPDLARLAAGNAANNRLDDRVTVATLDVTAPPASFSAAGLRGGAADHVLMNPPFNDSTSLNASPDVMRRLAHVAPSDTLAQWVARAGWLLAPDGMLTLIWRADGLAEVLATLGRGFGSVSVLPVYPRPDAAAIRILVRARKGGRAPLSLLSGLVLNDGNGRPAAEAEAVLRGGASLRLADL